MSEQAGTDHQIVFNLGLQPLISAAEKVLSPFAMLTRRKNSFCHCLFANSMLITSCSGKHDDTFFSVLQN